MESLFKNHRKGSRPANKCKVILSRVYFSRLMQAVYIILVILCIASIVLNFLIQVDFAVHTVLTILEIVICVIIVGEIVLRIYLQEKETCCSATNATDITITIFCIFGIILSFQSEMLKTFGNGATQTLLILRNIIFLVRLYLVFKHQNEINLRSVNIQQAFGETENNRKLSEMKIFKKFKPKMEILLEEEDDEESIGSQGAWKGKRTTPN